MDIKEFMEHFENNTRLENEIWLSDFAFWESRKKFSRLMENFITEKIDGRQFEKKFIRMRSANLNKNYSLKAVFEKIKDEEFPQVEDFSRMIGSLFTDCDVFEPDSSLRDEFGISEDELRSSVKKAFLMIQYRYT